MGDPGLYFVRKWALGYFRSIKNEYDLIRNLPGQKGVDKWMLDNPWAIAIGSAVASYFGGPVGAAFAAGYTTYAQTDGNVDAARKAGTITYLTAAAFSAVGDATMTETYGFDDGTSYTRNLSMSEMTAGQIAGNVAGHALVGCASSAASGGNCGQGALGAGFGAAAGFVPGAENLGTVGKGVWVTAVGGAASQLGGGSFLDGARSAMLGYLFNACDHGQCGSSPEERSLPVGASVEGAVEWTLTGQVAGKLGPLGSYAFGPGLTFDGILPVDFGFVTDYSLPIRAGGSLHFGGLAQVSALSGSMLAMNGTQSMSYSAALGPLSGNFGVGMQTGSGRGNLSGVTLTWSPVLNVGGAVQPQITRTFTIRGVYQWMATRLGGPK